MGVLVSGFLLELSRSKKIRTAPGGILSPPSFRSCSRPAFTALWLPPACKAANIGGPSMGYDPYDYYDLGDVNQKGRVKTWFGNQAELTTLINAAHTANMQVYADLVINHNNGGDAQETNPIDGSTRWTKFNPGSGKFPARLEEFSSLSLRNL